MTEEITRIRAALEAYQAATTLAETLDAVGEVEDACSADVMPAVLAHIDGQQAEIDRLKRGEFICLRCSLRKDADSVPADF